MESYQGTKENKQDASLYIDDLIVYCTQIEVIENSQPKKKSTKGKLTEQKGNSQKIRRKLKLFSCSFPV